MFFVMLARDVVPHRIFKSQRRADYNIEEIRRNAPCRIGSLKASNVPTTTLKKSEEMRGAAARLYRKQIVA